MRALLIVIALAGCGPPTPYLRWTAEPPAPSLQGRVSLRDVINKRDAKHGATDPAAVGNIRNGFGVPYPVRIDGGGGGWEGSIEPRTMGQSIGELVATAMMHAGVGVVAPNDPQPTSLLFVEVYELWCDGYVGYGASISLQLAIVDPATQQLRTKIPIRNEGSAGNCRDAFARALSGAEASIAAAFAQPEVRAAAITPGAPAAAMAPTGAVPVPTGAVPTGAMPAAPPPSTGGAGGCPVGKVVTADTAGRCCWPGQVFAPGRNSCVGVPVQCPPGTHVAGESCAP